MLTEVEKWLWADESGKVSGEYDSNCLYPIQLQTMGYANNWFSIELCGGAAARERAPFVPFNTMQYCACYFTSFFFFYLSRFTYCHNYSFLTVLLGFWSYVVSNKRNEKWPKVWDLFSVPTKYGVPIWCARIRMCALVQTLHRSTSQRARKKSERDLLYFFALCIFGIN